MTFYGANPKSTVGMVRFFLGGEGDAERSGEWLAGRVQSDGPSMKSVALNQINALHRVRELVQTEIERLSEIYREAERSQG
jgi:hypothetical protein